MIRISNKNPAKQSQLKEKSSITETINDSMVDVLDTDDSVLDCTTEEYEHETSSERQDNEENESQSDEEIETEDEQEYGEDEAPQSDLRLNSTQPSNSYSITTKAIVAICIIVLAIAITLRATNGKPNPSLNANRDGLKIYFERIDEIGRKYSKILSNKEVRMIKARLNVMRLEVSILMLVGKTRDTQCQVDPTLCIGKMIANSTQLQFNYLDASDRNFHSDRIQVELSSSLNQKFGQAVIIDNLERLPGQEVMNLFQFIDKDNIYKRKGLLLFIVYTDSDPTLGARNLNKFKDAEIVEKILSDKWSNQIAKDSLTSVISRLSGSILKLF